MDFRKQYDVVVAGGGVAGVAAALEAARSGMKTALVEKTIFLGGLATTGLVFGYLPLCDGRGTQVIYGIAEELLHASARYGPGVVSEKWRESPVNGKDVRYALTFSPASFILALDEEVVKAGVDVWLDTTICLPIMDGNRVAGIEVENKSGRGELLAKCVVDATGDADVAYRAGAECAYGENFATMWALQVSVARAERVASGNLGGAGLMDMVFLGYYNRAQAGPDRRMFDATDGKDVTEFVLETRAMLREYYQKAHAEGGEDARLKQYPITLPSMAQFRRTRRIVGQESLTDGQDGQRFESSIGLSCDWRKSGPIWEIPYGTLVPRNCEGVLAAGRCISAGGDAWDVLRVIPPAALTGQVAGLAAVLAIHKGVSPSRISAAEVQESLGKKGIPFHIDQVK